MYATQHTQRKVLRKMLCGLYATNAMQATHTIQSSCQGLWQLTSVETGSMV